jgi:mannosyltransferase
MLPMRLGNPRVAAGPEGEAPTGEDAVGRATGFRWDRATNVAVVVTLGVALWLRFWTPSALWFDEALTVDIARAPLHEIPGLLRHDGAPPLYYYMLHFWMGEFGQGNLATRSLAGVIGVINLPLAWLTGYRVGARWWAWDALSPAERSELQRRGRATAWAVTLLVASSPFVIYYDTEARMYGLVILLGTLAVLSYVSLLRRPSTWNAFGLAVVMSAAIYSHYWALYSLAVVGIGTAWCAWRGPYQRACRYALGALVVAGLSFLPWWPTFWFQLHHTGTPWAAPAQLTAVVFTVTQFAGGDSDPGRGLAVLFFFLAVLAIFGAPLDRWRVVLDLRTRPGVRAIAVGVIASVVLGLLAGRISGTTFADRYTAMIVFPALLCMGYGLAVIGSARVRNGFLAGAVVLGLLCAVPNAFLSRTGAGQVGKAIAAHAAVGDVVGFCPDQLGPAVSRVLGGRYREITFPRDAAPEIVDWVDYRSVVQRAKPGAFAALLEAMAGHTGTVWYVWAPGYAGFGDKCQVIAQELQSWPGHRASVVADTLPSDTPFEIYEGETLDRFRPV